MSTVQPSEAPHKRTRAGKNSGAQLSDDRDADARPQEHAAGGHILNFGDPLAPEAVREQLQRILDSPSFEASERRRRFLRYVVEEMLAGRAGRLKGYAIATDVFGRDQSFDPQTDPVVRLEARRLRRALEHYYLTGGRNDPVRIEIPKGGYAPVCERQESASATPSLARSGDPRILAEGPTLPPRQGRPRWHWLAAAGVAVALSAALALAATTASFWLTRGSAGPSSARGSADQQLAGPAVVIAPFENLSGSDAGHLFAGGLTQELITNLMRFKDLRVYAANSKEHWTEDPARFGEELQVAYQVKGSVLRAPDRIRLAVQLLELGSGRYVWSETYDRPLTTESIFDIQEVIASELAGRLAEPYGIVHEVSADLLHRHRPQTLSAYECVLRTFAYRRTFSRELYGPSRDCLEDTVRRDPSYLDAWAMLAYAHLDEYRWYSFGPLYRQPQSLDRALAAAQRAKDLDPDSVTSLSAYAAVQYYRGELDEAESAQRRAVALNPNNPEALAQLGWRLAFARDWDQGIGLVRQAVQKSMVGSGWYYMILAFDDYRRSDYRAALADMGKAGELGFFAGPAVVAMAEAELGNQEAARRALDEAVALDPTFAKDPRGAFRLHHTPEGLIDQFIDGLRKAGLEIPAAGTG